MAPQPVTVHQLTAGWSFKQTDASDDAWLPVASVPTNVHLDLIANEKYGYLPADLLRKPPSSSSSEPANHPSNQNPGPVLGLQRARRRVGG